MNICLQYLYTPNTILNTCGNIHNQTLEIGDRLYIYLNLSFVQQINIFCVPSAVLSREDLEIHKKPASGSLQSVEKSLGKHPL